MYGSFGAMAKFLIKFSCAILMAFLLQSALAQKSSKALEPPPRQGEWIGLASLEQTQCELGAVKIAATVEGDGLVVKTRDTSGPQTLSGKIDNTFSVSLRSPATSWRDAGNFGASGRNATVSITGQFRGDVFEGEFTRDGNQPSGLHPCFGAIYLVSRHLAEEHPGFLAKHDDMARLPDGKRRQKSLEVHWRTFVNQEAKRLETLGAERRAAALRKEQQMELERLTRTTAEQTRADRERQEARRRSAERREAERLARLTAEEDRQEAALREAARLEAERLEKDRPKKTDKGNKPQPASQSIVQELELLDKLLKSGLLNKSEYNRRKQAALDRRFGQAATADASTGDAMPVAEGVTFGDYHALIIGINNYRHIRKLRTAENDARQIADVLSKQYGFKTTLMLNPTRAQIIDRLDILRERLRFKDNLVIYYAGHGWLDQVTDVGYWMPVDARPKRRSNWISNAVVTNSLRAIKAKHIMFLADSCFAGRLTRGISVLPGVADYYQKMTHKKARVVITSGGLEPVDDGRGDHSPFAAALLRTLRSNQGILDGTRLFDAIRRPVMTAADQTPEYSDVRKAGHEGGDFIFVKRR